MTKASWTTTTALAIALAGLASSGCDDAKTPTAGNTTLLCEVGTKLIVGDEEVCVVGVDTPTNDITPPEDAILITETGAKPQPWYQVQPPVVSAETPSCDDEDSNFAVQVWRTIVCAPSDELDDQQVVQILKIVFDEQSDEGTTIEETTITKWQSTCKDYCAASGCPLPEGIAAAQCEEACLYGIMEVALQHGEACAESVNDLRQCLADSNCGEGTCDASTIWELCPYEPDTPNPEGATIVVSPVNVDFGTIELGSSATQEITVTNTGAAELVIGEMFLGGADEFSVSRSDGIVLNGNDQPSEDPLAIGPGQSETLTITFEPSDPSGFEATLLLQSNADNQPEVTVAIAAMAEEPQTWLSALEQAEWFIGVYNEGLPVSEEVLAEHFDPVFPVSDLKIVIDQLIEEERWGPRPLTNLTVTDEPEFSAWFTNANDVIHKMTLRLANNDGYLIAILNAPVDHSQNPNTAGELGSDQFDLNFWNGFSPLSGATVELLNFTTGASLDPAVTGTTDNYGFVRLTAPAGTPHFAAKITSAEGFTNYIFNDGVTESGVAGGYGFFTKEDVEKVYTDKGVARDPAQGEMYVLTNFFNPQDVGHDDIAQVLPTGCAPVSSTPAVGSVAYPTAASEGAVSPDADVTDPNMGVAWLLQADPGAYTVDLDPGSTPKSLPVPVVEADAVTMVFSQYKQPDYATNVTQDSCYVSPAELDCAMVDATSVEVFPTSAGAMGVRNDATQPIEVHFKTIWGDQQYLWQLEPGQTQYRWHPEGGIFVIKSVTTGACLKAFTVPKEGALATIEAADVPPPERLVVQLTWDTPGDLDQTDTGPGLGADLNIHLTEVDGVGLDINEDSVGDGYYTDGACYWKNISPDWGAPGNANNPSLDIDDTDGAGPETINLDDPEDKTYRVGVDYYDDHGYGPSTATVRIFIDGNLSAEFTKEMMAGGFWEVASVEFPTTSITDIDTYMDGIDFADLP